MANKILEGARQALSFVQGTGHAAKITTFPGGPYFNGPGKGLLQHKTNDGYIAWNWDTASWDKVTQPVEVRLPPTTLLE